jgi:hypothetical protein
MTKSEMWKKFYNDSVIKNPHSSYRYHIEYANERMKHYNNRCDKHRSTKSKYNESESILITKSKYKSIKINRDEEIVKFGEATILELSHLGLPASKNRYHKYRIRKKRHA